MLTSCFRDEIKIAILLERDLYFLALWPSLVQLFIVYSVSRKSASRESDCNDVKLIKWMFLPRPRLMRIASPIADEEEQT